MKKTSKKKITADEIADLADAGYDVTQFFGKGKMKQPVQRVNVDFRLDMLQELDDLASDLFISRQALIKTFLRQALDLHNLAKKKKIS